MSQKSTPSLALLLDRYRCASRHRGLDALLDESDGPNPLALLAYADWLDGHPAAVPAEAEAMRWAAEKGVWPTSGGWAVDRACLPEPLRTPTLALGVRHMDKRPTQTQGRSGRCWALARLRAAWAALPADERRALWDVPPRD